MDFSITNVGIIVLSIATIINGVLLAINMKRLKKYTKLYDKALAKFNAHGNVKDEFNSIYTRLNDVECKCEETVDTVNNFNNKIKNNVQKVGFVKYNAYDDTENKLSFAIALLDERENGILINHIYSKHGSNIYAKFVTEGKVDDRISEEEEMALKIASEDKAYKERKPVQVSKTNKIKNNKK